MKNAKPYHSKIYHSCHSERSEESHPACHSERSEESKNVESIMTESKNTKSTIAIKDSSFATQIQNDGDISPMPQHDAHSTRHSERSEESKIRDSIKDVLASPQHDKKQSKITLTHNQISINAKAFVYMVSNQTNTTLYIGVTSNLIKRMYEHKNKLTQGFTQKYNCNKLVYFESFETIQEAIQREKYLKGKKRDFKESLIDSINPKRLDLYNEILYPSNRDVSALPQHDKGNAQHDRIRHSELRSSEESKNVETQDTESRCFAFAQHDNPCHSEDFPPCHSDLERSEREESQNTESKKESESTKDKYDFQR